MKHLSIALLAGALLWPTIGNAGPKVRLQTPDQVSAGTETYEVSRLEFQFAAQHVFVDLVGENGITRSIIYSGAVARTFLEDIARSRVQIRNIQEFVLQRLIADGLLQGTVED